MSSKNKTTATKEEAQPGLVPKLRFSEFQRAESWKVTQLQKIAQPVSDRAASGDSDNVLSLSGEHGLILQSDYFGKKVAGDSADRYLKLRRNDFVYNDRTTKASTFGTIKRLSKYEGGIVSPIYKCFRFNIGENPVFWEWYFESGNHDSALRGLVNEGARAGRFNISISRFLSTVACRPDESEQKKIAECLSAVDDLIAAQTQKVDALKTYKKGLMQQLFPREGETQPRLRFPEFQNSGEWTPRKAGTLFANRVAKGEQGLPLYSVTMHDGMVKRDSLDRNFYDIEDAAGNKKVCKDDIAYNMMRMWQGALGVAPEDCLVSPAYIVLIPMKDAVPVFFQYLFKLPATLLLLTSHSRGLTKDRLRLYYDDFASIPLRCPAPPEQQRIASCLSSLEALIAAETQKFEALKAHKQGLMQQLFPSPEVDEA